MTDDTAKRVHDAIAAHVRARMREGYSPRDVRLELEGEISESVYRELARQVDHASAALGSTEAA